MVLEFLGSISGHRTTAVGYYHWSDIVVGGGWRDMVGYGGGMEMVVGLRRWWSDRNVLTEERVVGRRGC